MLISMKPSATQEEIERVCKRVRELGFTPHVIPGAQRVAIGITGNPGPIDPEHFSHLSGIADMIPVTKPYKLVSREVKPEDTIIEFPDASIGGDEIAVIAGPCAVESREQILETAYAVKKAGAKFLRGGAYKPRTSPYSFQGLKEEGLRLLAEAREKTGLYIVTEAKDVQTLPMVEEYADIIQIGARNMQNFSLLEAAGKASKPVLLKRGMWATITELFMAAEYILSQGNYRVILCERGIRTFETLTRNTLDLGAVTVIKQLSHLPVIVDPSHGIGIAASVPPLAKAAIAAGADGIMIEVHPDPSRALSDGPQSISFDNFFSLMRDLKEIAKIANRRF